MSPVKILIAPDAPQPFPSLLLVFQGFQNFQVGGNIFVGLLFGQGRFAQDIDDSRKAVFAQPFDIFYRLFRVLSDNELAVLELLAPKTGQVCVIRDIVMKFRQKF